MRIRAPISWVQVACGASMSTQATCQVLLGRRELCQQFLRLRRWSFGAG